MLQNNMCALLSILLLVAATACSDDAPPADQQPPANATDMMMPAPDADMRVDTPELPPPADEGIDLVEDMAPDLTEEPDEAPDMPVEPADMGWASACEGECAQTSLTIRQGGLERQLTRAFYGLSSPERSINGEWELHIEAAEGGSASCPTESSPTPDYTMAMTGLSVFSTRDVVAADAGLNLFVFDYVEDLVPDPPFWVRANEVEVTPVARSACEVCEGGEEEAMPPVGFVALDILGVWEGGEVEGHLYATRCASLDDL